jgi:hypothetical protein
MRIPSRGLVEAQLRYRYIAPKSQELSRAHQAESIRLYIHSDQCHSACLVLPFLWLHRLPSPDANLMHARVRMLMASEAVRRCLLWRSCQLSWSTAVASLCKTASFTIVITSISSSPSLWPSSHTFGFGNFQLFATVKATNNRCASSCDLT